MDRNSIWFALRNKRFRTLWLVTLISSSAVAAYNTAAVWLMNSLASSSFFLSLIPVLTSLAFFLFTLPAGIIADVMSRSKAVALINFGLALLCFCLGVTVWLGWINPVILLFGVLSLGIGFAFNGPAMAAIVPDLVSDSELSSAVTLGGLQLNISSMIGPAAGGFMILSLGPGGVFLVNALCFLMVVLAAQRIGETQSNFTAGRETFSGALFETFQVVRQNASIRMVVLRNFVFSLFVSLIPALFLVLALRQFRVDAPHLGILFTSLAAGSVLGIISVTSLKSLVYRLLCVRMLCDEAEVIMKVRKLRLALGLSLSVYVDAGHLCLTRRQTLLREYQRGRPIAFSPISEAMKRLLIKKRRSEPKGLSLPCQERRQDDQSRLVPCSDVLGVELIAVQ